MELFAKRIFAIDTENAFKLGPEITAIEKQGHKVIKLNLGEPDFNAPDFIKQELKDQIDKNNSHYCDPKGLLSLREAICHQIFTTRALKISPEQVVVFPGAKPGIGFSQEAYCNPGDEIIYPSPGFPIYESFIRYIGAIPVPLHLKEEEGFTFTAEELSRLMTPKTKLIFINFPSNPTGCLANQAQLEAISEVILSQGQPNLRVYSDEIYENIIFDGQRHHSIASVPGMEKLTIISSGFSKSYAWTGGRVGYAVFPTVEEANVFKNLNINYFSCVPPYNQEAARKALEFPGAKNSINEMVKNFQERRDLIMRLLHTIPGLSCQKPGGAFYAFPNIAVPCRELGVLRAFDALDQELKSKTTASTLLQKFALHRHHVAVLDRRSFGRIGSENMHFIRLSSAAKSSDLEEGVRRLKNAFEDVAGFQDFMKTHKHLF